MRIGCPNRTGTARCGTAGAGMHGRRRTVLIGLHRAGNILVHRNDAGRVRRIGRVVPTRGQRWTGGNGIAGGFVCRCRPGCTRGNGDRAMSRCAVRIVRRTGRCLTRSMRRQCMVEEDRWPGRGFGQQAFGRSMREVRRGLSRGVGLGHDP